MIEYVNSKEKVEEANKALKPDLSPLLGKWKNTDKASGNIVNVNFTLEKDSVIMHAWGDNQPELCKWGDAACAVFTSGIDTQIVEGLEAQYEFGFKSTKICGNVKLGILVLQVYNSFKDESGRLDYFSREFYHRVEN